MTRRERRTPRAGLAAVFTVLILAVACGLGLMVFKLKAADYIQQNETADELNFLTIASRLSYESLHPENAGAAYIIDNHESNALSFRRNFLLAGKDGAVLGMSAHFNTDYQTEKIYVKWWNGFAYMVYSNEPGLIVKFKATVYDGSYMSASTAPQGSFGYRFENVNVTEDALLKLNLAVSGRILIYITRNTSGTEAYLIEIKTGEPYDTMRYLKTNRPLPYDTAGLRATWNTLALAYPLLLALYWLLLPYWVYLDARRRVMRADIWVFAIFFTNLAGFIFYILAARSKTKREAVKTCAACGGRMLRAFPHCPWCGISQQICCPACGAEMRRGWAFCPHCAGKPPASEPAQAVLPVAEQQPAEALELPESEEEKTPELPVFFREGMS